MHCVVTIKVPWGEIRGCSWGRPDGKPVLAVHGKEAPLTMCVYMYLYSTVCIIYVLYVLVVNLSPNDV